MVKELADMRLASGLRNAMNRPGLVQDGTSVFHGRLGASMLKIVDVRRCQNPLRARFQVSGGAPKLLPRLLLFLNSIHTADTTALGVPSDTTHVLNRA